MDHTDTSERRWYPDRRGGAMSIDQQPVLREHRISFASSRAIMALILREISTTYGRSPGGYVWAVLEPAAGIALLTLIFSIGFRSPPLGTVFSLFYATGMLPLMMYMGLSGKLAQTIQFNRALLAYPRVTFVDAIAARLILNLLTQLTVQCLVVGFILITSDVPTTFDYGKIVLAYAMLIMLSIGIGTLNSFLTLAFPIWQTAWAILNRPLFIISCIFFLFESVPQPYADFLWYNPVIHIVGMMRDGYYPFYQPNYVSVAYPMGIGIVTLMIGLFLLRRYHRDMLDK